MRKKIERLERRNHRENKKAESLNLVENTHSKEYLLGLREIEKDEKQLDEWKAIRRHPITKIVLVVGVTMGLIYMSSHVLNLATRAATSYKNFRKALDS